MTQLLAWVWAPLLLYIVSLGLGLLTDRLLTTELPPAILAPVGLAPLVFLATLGYRLGLPPLAVTAVLVLAGGAGLVLARRRRWTEILSPPALIAGVVVYLLYMAPVILSGEATWAGYNFVNDTASNFLLADHLESSGLAVPSDVTGGATIVRYLLDVGYPLGSFSVVAALRPLTGAPLEAVYQPLMAGFAALCAMSLTDLARRSGLRPPATVVAATLPLGGVLLYRYALHGAIKEVLLVALLATAVALACIALERRLAVRPVILLALTCLGMVLVFSSAAAAFALALGGATLVAALLLPDRPDLRHVTRLAAVAVGVGLVALIPMLGAVLEFTQNIRAVFDASDGASTGAFGQLVRPLPVAEAAGVWVSRDYRYPADGPFNELLVASALLAAAAGLVVCAVQRRYPPLILLASALLPALAVSPLASPYIDGKLLVVLTPFVVFLGAIAGLTGLQARRWLIRFAGGLTLLALAAGVVLSDLYSYRDARLAPLDRVEAMKDVAAHVPDRGLYLLNEWEEYGKHFMNAARVNPASEAESDPETDRRVELRTDADLPRGSPERTPIFGRWFDLDRQTLEYVNSFAGVIMRRSPASSRPPASFRSVYRNGFYELWRRDRNVRVLGHLPLQSRDRATAVTNCEAVRRLARRARRGDRLVGARRPRVARLSPLQVSRPAAWPLSGDAKGTVTTNGPGVLRGTLAAQGSQRVWLRASATRALTVFVDGRRVGQARQIDTPDQWTDVGAVRLRAGKHRIEIRREGADWRPGDSVYGYLGPLTLESIGPSRLASYSPRDAGRLCGRSWDWIELVAGRP